MRNMQVVWWTVMGVVLATGCGEADPPEVALVAPISNEVIIERGPINIAFDVVDASRILEVALFVDGVRESAAIPLPDGDCDDGCRVSFTWSTHELAEGEHTVALSVEDEHGNVGSAERTVHLEDFPHVVVTSPVNRNESLGHASVDVQVEVTDRSPVSVEFSIDGTPIEAGPSMSGAGCAERCSFTQEVDTLPFADGEHQLEVVATDSFGRSHTFATPLSFADIPYVSQIEVVDEFDFNLLDIEVHIYDADTGQSLGCSGRDSGMAGVDFNDISYQVVGFFQSNATLTPLRASAISGRQVYLEVIEDDVNPCPDGVDGEDDLVGRTSALDGDSLPRTMQFGDVPFLQLDVGRPL